MLFGKRLADTRKNKNISQDELAKNIGVHAPIIGRYEREEVKPSVEVAVKIAEALGCSLDYLTGITNLEIDKDVLQNINDLQQLNEADKNHILKTLGALIREAKTRKAYAS